MKNFLTMIALIALVSSMSGCSYFKTKVIPAAKKSASEKITKAIVKVGECKNVAAVQADVNSLLKLESDGGVVVKAMASDSSDVSAKSLTASKSLLGDLCKSATSLAIPALLKKGVPEKWECSLTDLSSKSTELAAEACGKV